MSLIEMRGAVSGLKFTGSIPLANNRTPGASQGMGMKRSRFFSRMIVAILCVAIVTQLAACGTLMYPERKGQTGGTIDVGVAILDGLGLLLFIIPGLIAYGVDFSTGAIYLPPDSAALEDGEEHAATGDRPRVIYLDPGEMTEEAIEDAVAKATGIAIEIDGESTQVFRHAFRSSLADEVVKLNLEYRTTTLALAD